MSKPKIIAFYLPQYHPTPDNDKWWGKGFTEWTNVGKAEPLFPGHYQPKVPADLGYYDLRLPEVREAQAELAREAGIYGFCYYHYWFGNGKEELELPFNEVLRLGKPDFPFMLCWANESWHKKFWDKDGKGSSKEMLIEQTYPGKEDIKNHFYRLLPAFKDKRYIKIGGRNAFMIYKPFLYSEVKTFISIWQGLANENNLPPFYFIAQKQSNKELPYDEISILNKYKELGFDALNIVRLYDARNEVSLLYRGWNYIKRLIFRQPNVFPYSRIIPNLHKSNDGHKNIFPTIIPNWDHTPRSGINGLVFQNATPCLFKKHLTNVLSIIQNKDNDEDNVVFIKSWNEWGEGNYIEPDLKNGKAYLHVLKECLREI